LSDITDVVFQGDSFTKHIKRDKVYFQLEGVEFYENTPNYQYLLERNLFISLNRSELVINAGLIMGESILVTKNIDFLLHYCDYKTYINNQYKNDQGSLNYIVYSNKLKEKNISYEIDMINGLFTTVILMIVNETNKTIRLVNIMTFDYQTVTIVIHQFSYETKIKELIFQSCP
jgi:hypothetical protein